MFPRAACLSNKNIFGAFIFIITCLLLKTRVPTIYWSQKSVEIELKYGSPRRASSAQITTVDIFTSVKSSIQTLGAVNPHPFNWLLVEKDLCSDRRKDLFILAIVHSAPANVKLRMQIRETWGSQRFYSKTKTVVVFALGYTKNALVQAVVKKESHSYRDVLQEDFMDTYKNLTYKAIMWLKFVSEHCTQAEYILKTDDDVFVNIFAVVDFLNRITQQNVRPRKSIMCFVWKGMDVIRDPKDKWYVNKEEYVPDIFPPYCSGAAYIITRDLIRPMYEQSFKIKFIWVDDFFITGALIEALQAEHFSINFLYAFEGIRTKEQLRHSSEYTFFAHSNVNLRLAMWKDVVKRQGIEIN